MQLHLLGTAGYHPSATRHTACLMLPEVGVVLDAGTGFFRVRERLQRPELDVFLSHAHLDHVVGLSYLFSTAYQTQLETVRVHGDQAKLAAIEEHLLVDALFPAKLPCTFCPLTGPITLPDGGQLTYHPLAHPGGSLGYRLDWPTRSLAYITDTTAVADAEYVSFVRGVNVLIHECNFSDGMADWAQKTGHSCLTPVVQVANAAGVSRLVLVHANPLENEVEPLDLAAARRVFANTELGCDEQVINF